MTHPLRRFIDRLRTPLDDHDPEAALDDAGLEIWTADESSPDAVHRFGFADPRAGADCKVLRYPPADEPMESFPRDWPFLRGRASTLTEMRAGDDSIRLMYWSGTYDIAQFVRELRAERERAGWELRLDRDYAPDAPLPQHLGWVYRGGDARLLTVAPDGVGNAVVSLVQARYDHLANPPAPPDRAGAGE